MSCTLSTWSDCPSGLAKQIRGGGVFLFLFGGCTTNLLLLLSVQFYFSPQLQSRREPNEMGRDRDLHEQASVASPA